MFGGNYIRTSCTDFLSDMKVNFEGTRAPVIQHAQRERERGREREMLQHVICNTCQEATILRHRIICMYADITWTLNRMWIRFNWPFCSGVKLGLSHWGKNTG